MTNKPKVLKRRFWIGLGVLALVGMAAGGAWFGWQRVTAQGATDLAQTEIVGEYQTSEARLGDVAYTISGTGNVVTDVSVDLGFSVEGVVAELNVQPGDVVTKGQELAKLADVEELELKVETYEIAVQSAQKTLDDLQANGAKVVSQALADLANAQEAYAEAKTNLHQEGDGRCASSLTQDYYFQYLYAQQDVDVWEGYLNDGGSGYGESYIMENLSEKRKLRDKAYANWTYCQGYTDEEIKTSEADFKLAEAALKLAEAKYADRQADGGVDAEQVALAQAALDDATKKLANAQEDLEGAVITATIDGTVMSVATEVGDTASVGAMITLADLEHPRVQVNIDETDLVNFAEGCPAVVTFDSLENQTFSGTVTHVSPSMAEVSSVAYVQGLVDLENTKTLSGKALALGLTGTVEVTCQEAEDVLVIPAQALYPEDDQSYYVYVLDAQGQPEKREVETGIVTVASAEIRSGLEEGEKVILSSVETE